MNAHPASLYHVSFRMQRDDFIALCQTVAMTPAPVVALRIVGYFAFVLALAFLSAGFSLDRLGLMLSDAFLTADALFYLPLVAAVPVLLLLQKHVIALFAGATYAKSAIAGRDIVLDLDVDGVEGGDRDLRFRYAWGAVQRLVATPTHLFILVSKREALIVPRRAVATDEIFANIVGFVRARTGLPTG